jgi:hypothetical protein
MSFDDIMNINNNTINTDSDISIEGGSKVTEPLSKTTESHSKVATEQQNIIIEPKICKDELKEVCTNNIQTDKDKVKNIYKSIPIKDIHQIPTTTKDSKPTKETTKDKTEDKDKVNIVIKSCKNITSKQALLIIPITKYFSNRPTLNKLITILKGESISLRLIDWFVTNFCKKNNVLYNLNDFKEESEKADKTKEQLQSFDNFIIVHNNYKGQLKAYSKRNFDPFCRRNRIRFYYEDNKYFITTVGQLNFFKWALENYIINYINIHLKEIDADMNLRCETVKKPGTKIHLNSVSAEDCVGTINTSGTKKNKQQEGTIAIETPLFVSKTKKGGTTRKKRKEISHAASKSLSIHNFPMTLNFD